VNRLRRRLDDGIRYFRTRRMRRFARQFAITPETRILDVGGTEYNWLLLDEPPRVTLINLTRDVAPPSRGSFQTLGGDGRYLPFADQSFDLVFSNSVIEHVGGRDEQLLFAREIARVGRSYWVQTPDRGFPVEPHLLTPGLHYLPRDLRRALAREFTVWNMVERPTPDRWEFYIRHCIDEMRLLNAAELAELFPGAAIHHERLCGLSRALIAYRNS